MKAGCGSLITSSGGLSVVLVKSFPDFSWDWNKLHSPSKKASQRYLKLILMGIFPNAGKFFEV
jgi:hypothetical protein